MTELFRFPSASRRDPAVEEWLRSRSPDLAPIARIWFDQMRKCGPDVTELMHDGCPVACAGDAAFGYVNAFSSHVNVGFFLGAYLDDPADMLEGAGKRMRHMKLRPGANYDQKALSRLIEDAYMDVKKRVADSAA